MKYPLKGQLFTELRCVDSKIRFSSKSLINAAVCWEGNVIFADNKERRSRVTNHVWHQSPDILLINCAGERVAEDKHSEAIKLYWLTPLLFVEDLQVSTDSNLAGWYLVTGHHGWDLVKHSFGFRSRNSKFFPYIFVCRVLNIILTRDQMASEFLEQRMNINLFLN